MQGAGDKRQYKTKKTVFFYSKFWRSFGRMLRNYFDQKVWVSCQLGMEADQCQSIFAANWSFGLCFLVNAFLIGMMFSWVSLCYSWNTTQLPCQRNTLLRRARRISLPTSKTRGIQKPVTGLQRIRLNEKILPTWWGSGRLSFGTEQWDWVFEPHLLLVNWAWNKLL